jgi:CYTH domain-containing protein
VRTRIAHGHHVWEVDRFLDLPVVLAECELGSADERLEMPAWLAPFVVREVTEEPAFRNSELARRAGLLGGAGG